MVNRPTDNKRTELQEYLDSIASENNKIDVVFVFDSKRGQILFFSKSKGFYGFGGEESKTILAKLSGKVKDIPKSLSGTDLGNVRYLVIPFDKGLLSLYFEDKLFTTPIIIGFVYRGNDGESAMGEMLFNADTGNEQIKKYLKDVFI